MHLPYFPCPVLDLSRIKNLRATAFAAGGMGKGENVDDAFVVIHLSDGDDPRNTLLGVLRVSRPHIEVIAEVWFKTLGVHISYIEAESKKQ